MEESASSGTPFGADEACEVREKRKRREKKEGRSRAARVRVFPPMMRELMQTDAMRARYLSGRAC
jgi:hypothetical protein